MDHNANADSGGAPLPAGDTPPKRGGILDDVLYYVLVAGMVFMCLAAPIAYVITGMTCEGEHYSIVMCRPVAEPESFIYQVGTKP